MTTPVSFELAKLLKGKKYSQKISSLNYYKPDGNLIDVYFAANNKNYRDFTIYAPTIAEVVMWLYEKHGIWIVSIPSTIGEGFDCNYYVGKDKFGINKHPSFVINSPTEAYEAAIEFTLNNLI